MSIRLFSHGVICGIPICLFGVLALCFAVYVFVSGVYNSSILAYPILPIAIVVGIIAVFNGVRCVIDFRT